MTGLMERLEGDTLGWLEDVIISEVEVLEDNDMIDEETRAWELGCAAAVLSAIGIEKGRRKAGGQGVHTVPVQAEDCRA